MHWNQIKPILAGRGKESIEEVQEARPWLSIIQDVSAESLMTKTMMRGRGGSIVYTDKWREYDSLIFCDCKPLNINHCFKFK